MGTFLVTTWKLVGCWGEEVSRNLHQIAVYTFLNCHASVNCLSDQKCLGEWKRLQRGLGPQNINQSEYVRIYLR